MAGQRSAVVMLSPVETLWIYSHSAPTSFPVGIGFTKLKMKQFPNGHGIHLKDHPVRRDNQTSKYRKETSDNRDYIGRLTELQDTFIRREATIKCKIYIKCIFEVKCYELVRAGSSL